MRSLLTLLVLLACASAYCHPGGLDANGGHFNRKTGEYHVHRSGGYSRPSVPTTPSPQTLAPSVRPERPPRVTTPKPPRRPRTPKAPVDDTAKSSDDELASRLFSDGASAATTPDADFATLHSIDRHVFHDQSGEVLVVGDATSMHGDKITLTRSDGSEQTSSLNALSVADQLLVVAEHRPSLLRSTKASSVEDVYRVWSSADGRYTVEAKAIAFDGKSVRLKLKGDRVKSVDLSKLSLEDSAYLLLARELASSVKQPSGLASRPR